MTWSWGPLLSQTESLAAHLLLVAFPKNCSVPTTWGPLHDWIACSFAQGDQEFFSNILKMPHWQNKFPCAECDAQKPAFKGIKCPDGKSVKLLRQADQKFVYVSPEQALLVKRSAHPLFQVPGISAAMVRGDSLHILYSRGVASHLAGSLIHYLCYFDGVKTRYVQNQVSSRLTNLRLSMTCPDAAKPRKSFACLEAKAAETKHLLPCLLQVLREALPEDDPIHQAMLACLEALIQIADLYDAIGLFPTSEEFLQAANLAKRFFSNERFALEREADGSGAQLPGPEAVRKLHTDRREM